MKVQLWSASGRPVDPAHKEIIKESMNSKMDEIEKEKGKICYDTAKEFQEILVPYHEELMKKYPISTEIDLPANEAEFKALCEKYDTAIAFCIEENKVVAYCMDSPEI